VYRAPDAADWQAVTREIQRTQQADFDNVFEGVAGRSIAIGNLLIVRPTDGRFVHADARVGGTVTGMALTAGSPGQGITFVRTGAVERPDWRTVIDEIKLTPGGVYFLSLNGGMRLEPPTEGFVVRVGQAITTDLFALQVFDSIRL
jgi:hypothetical protein